MYSIQKIRIPKTKRSKIKVVDKIEAEGFVMPSRQNKFPINGMIVKNILIVDVKLARPIVTKKVNKLYKKLIMVLTELLITDDDSGESFREALNQIERFRQEIKNKYRAYLAKKDLDTMSKQLKMFQLEAKNRFIELQMSYQAMNENGKSR